jgi:hypothetical protein
MPDLREAQTRLLKLRTARDDARAALRQRVFKLQGLDAAILAGERSGSRAQVERLRRERDAAATELEESKTGLTGAQAGVRDATATLFEDQPQRLIEQMEDGVPFLLLPLRIETKFSGTGGAQELLVRIFPDDIAVALHEKMLTAGEAQAGQVYWKARALANAMPDLEDRANTQQGAWNTLAGRQGAYRASWIAKVSTPTNWADTVTNPASLVFPVIETKPDSWTEAPRSFVLPDRFVVTLFSGSQRLQVAGAFIPDDLVLGPDPLQAEGFLNRDPATGRIVMDDDLKWIVDFDRAVALGMALRIQLTPPWNTVPIEKLVVLGIRASAGSEDGRTLLERLIESHRYSRGMGVVPQGTPTNNTDSAQSGFTTSSATIDETFALEQNPDALAASGDPLTQSDGQRLAEALGISLDATRGLLNASRTDVAEGIAMNRALWTATLGGFLRDMLKPLVDDATFGSLHRFFSSFVLGRGLLPSVRVGSQPYGILTTSALSAWQWAPDEAAGQETFWAGLLAQLRKLDGVWRHLLGNVSFVGKQPGDPFAQLLSVIGLQASSVEYYARKAVTDDYLWNYIRLKGTPQAYATGIWEEIQTEKAANFNLLGLDLTAAFQLKQLTFWREHDQLTGPVVDGDPAVPLAEDKTIRPYDAVHNYIDWLLSSSRAEIESESFTGSDGQPAPPPRALLYQLLRHAYLSELGQAGINFLKDRAAAVFAELPGESVITNVGTDRSLVLHDLMNVDTEKIGVTSASGTVGDYLLTHARAVVAPADQPAEVIALADMTAALRLLATLPTARLERAFSEHLDLSSYRLDAWVQGIFGLRLQRLREGRQETGGTYLGAFGWVENLRSNTANKQPVGIEDIPEPLRADLTGTVVEYTNSGGYIHAPSLTQAVSAAVLRSAYLTHAEPSQAAVMSVNLSSSRVRNALSYLDGLRGGQELSALLGYQLERGLHEGHPEVELDEFISVLRERFPLISKKLTPVSDGEAAEVIEARNVINGYDLLDFVRGKSYPWGLAGLPADPSRAGAIQAEVDRLADAMDAIGDVLMAESVHQMVQGNYARGKGVLQSITEGEAPPEIEIVQTPRSGRGLTYRVALQFDPGQNAGWSPLLTPRATANKPLNHWLSTVLPSPDRIQWKATRGTASSEFVGLDTLGLEPIDIVLMCGEKLGDFSSELERFLVYTYRVTRAIPDEMRTFLFEKTDSTVPDEEALVVDPGSAAANGVPLASLLPMLKALRRVVSQSRPLHANDFLLPSEAQTADPANPKGYDDTVPPLKDVAELKSRVETAFATLQAAATDLDVFLTGAVQPIYDALESDPSHSVVPAWSAVLVSLRGKLVSICAAGVPEALPTGGLAVTEPAIGSLVLAARTILKIVNSRLAGARALIDGTITDPLPADPGDAARELARRIDLRVGNYTEAAKLLMGRSFVVVPLYKLHASGQPELAAALAAPVESNPLVVEGWLQSLTRVRASMEALGWVATYHDWLHADPLAIIPAQLPVHPGDAWIGTDAGAAAAAGELLSVAICNPPADVSAVQCGLLIDEWTEVVPTEKETTGIAFHANRPNAQPPQALLLAVTPQLRGTWRWDDLLTIVTETLDRAKLRAVEPDMILPTEYFQLLPSTLTGFSAGRAFPSTVLAFNSAARISES